MLCQLNQEFNDFVTLVNKMYKLCEFVVFLYYFEVKFTWERRRNLYDNDCSCCSFKFSSMLAFWSTLYRFFEKKDNNPYMDKYALGLN